MTSARTWAVSLAGLVLLLGCEPKASTAPVKKGTTARIDYASIPPLVRKMLPRIRAHVKTLAGFGPRQTGQEGCRRALEYIRATLKQMAPDLRLREFSSTVTVPLDRPGADQLNSTDEQYTHVVVSIPGQPRQRWPAYAFMPNCVQSCRTHPPQDCPLRRPGQDGPFCPNCEQDRRVVDLGAGEDDDFRGKDLSDAVVVLDFNSGDAWLRAASLGAAGAVILEPRRTTVFQADKKYLATLPLNFPRLYLRDREARRLRAAMKQHPGQVRIRLKSRLRFRNVRARCLELTIPGSRPPTSNQPAYCYVLAGHFDARCIVPDLSYGAAELWGVGELLEVTRYLLARKQPADIKVLFVSGHWQSQRTMRDYLAPDGENFEKVGRYYKLALAFDLVPEGRAVNVLSESAWDVQSSAAYGWLGQRLFAKGGWRDQIFEKLDLPRVRPVSDELEEASTALAQIPFSPPVAAAVQGALGCAQLRLVADDVELFGGVRPTHAETLDGRLAARNDRCPLIYAPRYPTAEEAFQALGLTALALQTGRLARLEHNTPLDRLRELPAEEVDGRLGPQLQIALAVLENLLQYPAELFPRITARKRSGRGWGGYAQITGKVQQWDRSIGFFAGRLPAEKNGQPLRTFLYVVPTDKVFTDRIGKRLRNYLAWPLNPSRGQHRELQSFMFQDLLLLQRPDFRINTVYAGFPDTQYDVVAYSLDEAGRIRFATDFGIHGDSNKSFQCTDLDLDSWNLYVPVNLFECGTVELFGLVDPQRYDPNIEPFGSWLRTYLIHGDHADKGIAPHLKVTGVKDVDSHTDLERWGFAQYGPTAMVFLPADFITGAEILLGSWFTNFAVLNNPDRQGRPRGYLLHSGESIRLSSAAAPTALVCLRQLTALNLRRMRQFAAHDVASPLAKRYQADSLAAVRAAQKAQAQGDIPKAQADYMRGWIFESLAYRNTVRLLVDVVSTTVFSFVLLLPFSFLLERLAFPQRTLLRSAVVSAVIFATFAAVLYVFHPGFKLAHNVVVTTTAFIIVVMTIPALILLLVRGVTMLRAIGSKAVITQRSEAESAGVVMAALSLAVSNMRRRRLRTALTLLTITALVTALVLLTTSAAFDFKLREPSGSSDASVEGVEVFNARDRRMGLLPETVKMYEQSLRDEALVIRREGVNYGYDHRVTSGNGALYLRHGTRRVAVPYFQLMDERDDLVTYRLDLGPVPPEVPVGSELDFVRTHPLVAGNIRLRDPARKVRLFTRNQNGKTLREVWLELHLSDLIVRGEFLAPGDVDVCLLPNTMARALGVDVGDTVTMMGLPLKVKGVFVAQTRMKPPPKFREARIDPWTGLNAQLALALYVLGLAAAAGATARWIVRGSSRARRALACAAVIVVLGGSVWLAHPGFRTVRRTIAAGEQLVYVPGPIDRLRDLDGLPITTLRSDMFRQAEPDNPLHAPSTEIVIVPRRWVRRYGILPVTVHSMLVIPHGSDKDKTLITRLAERLAKEILNVDVYTNTFLEETDPATGQVSLKSRSERISMHTATHVKGSSMMLVVMAVAVLMILAIMTGTVYERMREIHIFSSVGLSPRHVAGMFLIEALVYAGIAAVLGYFAGIICLKGLLAYLKSIGARQEFYPNYLGVFVLYSIGIAVLATLASSLYPIRLAAKIVNPSAARTWKLQEEPGSGAGEQEDRWLVRLPFIATTWEEARAMMVYAYDYLAIHQGERSGRFVCERPPAGRREGRTLGLYMPVWLAPFERNLSQEADLGIRPAQDADWWEMSLELRRVSGPAYLWKRGATIFVNMLCKHLLRWRAATPQQEAECLQRSDDIFPQKG